MVEACTGNFIAFLILLNCDRSNFIAQLREGEIITILYCFRKQRQVDGEHSAAEPNSFICAFSTNHKAHVNLVGPSGQASFLLLWWLSFLLDHHHHRTQKPSLPSKSLDLAPSCNQQRPKGCGRKKKKKPTPALKRTILVHPRQMMLMLARMSSCPPTQSKHQTPWPSNECPLVPFSSFLILVSKKKKKQQSKKKKKKIVNIIIFIILVSGRVPLSTLLLLLA